MEKVIKLTEMRIESDNLNIMVVPDGHYFKLPNGDVYVESVFNYSFFERYLSVFEKVYVLGRITHIESIPNDMKLASGQNVEFLDFPAFKGPWEYLINYSKIKKIAKSYSYTFDSAIFRVPGATANILSREFAKTKKPFAVEVVVDPWEYFKKGTVNSITRPIVRYNWTKYLKKICKTANGVSYVTKEYLQRKYPSRSLLIGESEEYFSTNYSSVSISRDSYGEPKEYYEKEEYVLSHAANSFTTYGKGHITLLKTLKLLRGQGYNVKINFIGDGPLKKEFIEYAKKLNVHTHVNFIGRLPDNNAVRKIMKDSDMFIFPTMAEGLPRVLLEAMSVGVPCISSPVSGIPEILDEAFLIDYDDYEGYSNKIIELINNRELLNEASKKNIEVAKEYSEDILNKKRKIFFERLLNLAEKI